MNGDSGDKQREMREDREKVQAMLSEPREERVCGMHWS